MLRRCLFCHLPFGPNDQFQYCATSGQIAFDPERGRLWCICEGCRRWSLVPFEARWEALEELERASRDRARLVHQGESIALLQIGGVKLIRVGQASLQEEASWRYGRQLLQRYTRARKIVGRGRLAYVAWLILLGIPVFGAWEGDFWVNRARNYQFGRSAWRGWRHCAQCGTAIDRIDFKTRDWIRLAAGRGQLPAIELPCRNCGGGALLDGAEATHTLRRILAFHNFGGADFDGIRSAIQVVEQQGSPWQFLKQSQAARIIVTASPSYALGLEIALNEENEKALLALDVAALERHWLEEEKLAAIVDSELTPLPLAQRKTD